MGGVGTKPSEPNKTTEMDNDKAWALYHALNDKSGGWYSLGLTKTAFLTGIKEANLDDYEFPDGIYGKQFKTLTNDHINIFAFKGVTYIGLESRRIDYETDKVQGTNKIEEMIQNGLYDMK